MSEWISVKDRLPDRHEIVLITIRENWGKGWKYYTDTAIHKPCYTKEEWCTFNDWDEGQPFEVTHWMPLPKPPKENE